MDLEPQDNLLALPGIEDTPVSPGVAVAALALNFAAKYHDTNMVKDGALYQQYKLEGRNFRPYDLDWLFETAIQIERHLMGGANRLSEMVYETLADSIADELAGEDPESEAPNPSLSAVGPGDAG